MPVHAPACFGAASVFAYDSSICQKCVAFIECSKTSLETLESIKGLVFVEDIMKLHMKAKKIAEGTSGEMPTEHPAPVKPPAKDIQAERTTSVAKVSFEIDEEQNQALAKITNSKGKDQFIVLCKRGQLDEMRKDLAEGRNTFDKGGSKHFKVMVDLLLAGGCSKRDLKTAYVDQFGWGEASASSHVSMLWPGFIAFGLAQETEGRLVLVPGGDK